MIKQKTLFFLNLFAFSITLALIVLPHHHHDGDVCIINAACHTDHSHDRKNEQGQGNQHQHCEKDHIYLLEKGLIVRSNSFVLLLKTPEFSGNLKILDLYFSSPARSSIIAYVPPIYDRGLLCYETSLHSSYVNLSLGLRAPPSA